MAGILANSSAVTMVAGDTQPTNAFVGFVTTQQVTLSVTPTGTIYQWSVSLPAGSSAARAALSSAIVASPRFTPDVAGEYVVTCLVDSTTLYVLRMSVSAAVVQSATGGFRMLRNVDTAVATPATGDVLYNSTTQGFLSARGADGVVRVLADRAWVQQAIALSVLRNIPTLSVQGTATTGDNVPVSATTSDTDGYTTTGVDLYNGTTRVGAMANGGGGSWSLTIANVAAGTYSLTARRLTAIGYQVSTEHDLVVSNQANAPGNMNVNTSTGNIQVDTTTGNTQVGL